MHLARPCVISPSTLTRRPAPPFHDRIAFGIAAALLIAQGFGVARMLWATDRFFAWAPHDQRTDFVVSASHEGRAVALSEIARRYGLPPTDWHAAHNVLQTIETAEERLPPRDRWTVVVRYRINFGAERVWTHPDAP